MKPLIFLSMLLAAMAHAADPNAEKPAADLSYIYILMDDKDRPKLDYEGDGILRSALTQRPDLKTASYKLELIALKIGKGESFVLGGVDDKPENYIIKFTGKLERTGENQIRITGTVESKIDGIVQFVEMTRDKQEPTKDFPEISFKAGASKIEFSGKVLAWIGK